MISIMSFKSKDLDGHRNLEENYSDTYPSRPPRVQELATLSVCSLGS